MRYLADARQLAGLVDDLADQIDRLVNRSEVWNLVGIRSRGVVLASRLAERLSPTHLGTLDITLYRDDLSEIGNQPVVRPTELDFAVDGCDLVLVDDVIMTGRSIRAAMQSIMDLGRPSRIWLAVLVDRGGRELPIQPDMVALDLTTTPGSTPGTAPGSALGTTPGSTPGTTPGSTPGTTPGSAPGQRPCEASAKQGSALGGSPTDRKGPMSGSASPAAVGSGGQAASVTASESVASPAPGHRDVAGLLSPDQKVVVRLTPTDTEDAILLGTPNEKSQAAGD